MTASMAPAAHLTDLLRRRPGRPVPLGVGLPAGFPTMDGCTAVLEQAVLDGASFLVLGVPSPAPYLDGLDIAQAHLTALRAGTTTKDVFTLVRRLAPAAPVVVTAYATPLLRSGLEMWAQELAHAGAAGCMIVDLPEDEAPGWHRAADSYGLHAPRLLDHTAGEERAARLARAATGWLHLTPAPGHDGLLDIPALAGRCARVRVHDGPPLVLGGGLSTPQLAGEVAALSLADGFVIGSPVARELLTRRPGREAVNAAGELVGRYARALRTAGPQTGNTPAASTACDRRGPGLREAAS